MALISVSAFAAGFSAAAVQIIVMREFLASFYGNEISVGIVLASWLVITAFGASAAAPLARKIKEKGLLLSASFLIAALLPPLAVLASRWIKPFLKVPAGGLVSFGFIFLSAFAVITPFCLVSGFLFVFLSDALVEKKIKDAAGRIYFLDVCGMCVGALATGILFIRILPHIEIAVALSEINFILAALWSKRRRPNFAFAVVCFLFYAFMQGEGFWLRLDKKSHQSLYKGYKLLKVKDTIYGRLAAAGRESCVSLFSDGCLLFTSGDEAAQEDEAHFALLEHPWPEKVLVIGASSAGALGEVLKHPLAKADYLVLDSGVTEMSEELIPGMREVFRDGRLNIINSDARYFLSKTDKKYDCIIMNEGIPFTARRNRFYTVEFFAKVKDALKKGGVFSFGLPSSENYISPPACALLASVRKTLEEVFSDVKIIPGFTAYFLASDGGALTCDYKKLLKRADERKLRLKYVREYYLSSRMSAQKIKWMNDTLDKAPFAVINRDLSPLAYYKGLVFLTGYFKNSLLNKMLLSISKKPSFIFFAALFLGGLLFAVSAGGRERAVTAVSAVCGFSGMVFQILILVSFETLFGFLFYRIGVITALFMAGMAGGCLAATRIQKGNFKLFAAVQAAVALFAFAAAFLMYLLPRIPAAVKAPEILFYLISALSGFFAGFQFPLANRILADSGSAVAAAGRIYAADLFGSCAGAFAVTIILLPLLGASGAFFFTGLLGLIAFAGLFSYNFNHRYGGKK